MFPPLPSWDTTHPIAVHLPLGVLAVVPLLAIWAMLAWGGANRRTVGWAVMLVLVVGAGGTVLAKESGEAAEAVAVVPGAAAKLLDRHSELGELARNCMLGMAAAYAVIMVLATVLKDRLRRWIWVTAHAVWLVGFAASLLVLLNAGHLGGRLVHEFGVRAPMHEGGQAETEK